jgi:DNA mismatch repair protein MutL
MSLVPGVASKQKTTGRQPAGWKDFEQLTLEAQRPQLGESTDQYRNYSRETPPFWQLQNRYILSQIKSGLTIIDQHVAHERILYERALHAKKENIGFSQQLLFPQTVTLPKEDYAVLIEILPYMEKIGFGLKEFGRDTIVIEAVPVEIKTGKERNVLLEIIDMYKNLRHEIPDVLEAVAKSFACKSAIKSGERLSLQEMASLVDQLFATEEPYFCPHGRPVVVNLNLEELDRRFGR